MATFSQKSCLRKLFVIAFFILPFSAVQAQQSNQQDHGVIQEFSNPSNTIHTHPNEVVHGTPFFNKDWDQGHVLLQSGKKTKQMPLKYKIYSNELLFKRQGKKLAVVPRTMKGFTLMHDGQKLLFKNGFHSSKYKINPNRLLQVIYDGKVKVLKKYRVQFMRGQRPDPMSGNITSNFIKHDDYYLVDHNGRFHKIKLKRKDILSALGNHQTALTKYAKSNNLNFGDKNDLEKILSHYDQLNS